MFFAFIILHCLPENRSALFFKGVAIFVVVVVKRCAIRSPRDMHSMASGFLFEAFNCG